MIITKANVEEYAKQKGYELVQLEGVIDGFAWREPNITIGGVEHKGRIITFKPLADWQDKDSITYE